MSLYKNTQRGEIREIDDKIIAAQKGTPKEWLWEPYTAPELPEPVPESVTKRQLFLVLNAEKGITRAAISAMIAQNPNEKERENGLIEVEEAGSYERTHPLIAQLASALQLSTEDVDHIFRAAAKL